jgi:glycosyltransferase involved in cell wall biosynthesis
MRAAAVTMFVYNDVRTDARVRKEAKALADAGCVVTVIGRGAPGVPPDERVEGFRIVRTPPRAGTGPGSESPWRPHRRGGILARVGWIVGYGSDFISWRRAALRVAARARSTGAFEVWHGHDMTGVVVAAAARRRWGGSLVYDSHELYLEAGSAARLPALARRALARWERALARGADAVITVNDTIADELLTRYRIPRPAVVMNCPPVVEQTPAAESPLRSVLGLDGRRVLLHHGGIAEGRGIRQAIGALNLLPADVALVVLGNGELVGPLGLIATEPRYRDRLFLHPAVEIHELPAWIGGADVGLVTFEPVDLNNEYASPNKLFEYLMQGVSPVVSDFPELRRVVQRNDLGVTCDPLSPRSVADAVSRLLNEAPAERAARRARCRAAAIETYSWERQQPTLISTYERLAEEAA